MRWFPLLLLFAGCASPLVSVTSTGNLNEPDGMASVVISRADGESEDVTVSLSYSGTLGPAEYSGAQRTVTVSPNGFVTIFLSAVDDTLHEPSKSLTVAIVPSDDFKIDKGSTTITAADDDPNTPPDDSFDDLAKRVAGWKSTFPLGLAAQAGAIGRIYLTAAYDLDTLKIGSIGQAGASIREQIGQLVQDADEAAWEDFAGRVDQVWIKYQVSADRRKAISFFKIVGESLK